MKKYTIVILVSFLFVIPAALANAESLQTKLVPEEAIWLVHIDVAKFAKTQLKGILEDKTEGKFGKEIRTIEKTANIKFLDDISAVTAIGMANDEEPVIAFSGNLNKDHLLSLLKEEETPEEIQHGEFLIYNWDDDECGVFIHDRLVLISENRYGIEKVLDSFSGKGKSISGSSLQQQLNSLSPMTFLVAAAEDVSKMIDEDEDDFGAVILKKTEKAFFTAEEQQNELKLKLSLQTDSPETAQNMEGMVTGLKSFLAMHEKIDPEWEILKNLRISVKNNKVQLESESAYEELLHVLLGIKK